MTPTPTVDVRRASERAHARLDWLTSHASFSGAASWDPSRGRQRNTHHGVLVNHNEDVIEPGTGFDTHYHRNMEIVTWVLEGSLVHQDTRGNAGIIYPGLAQRMSAGAGILHSERNDSWLFDANHDAHEQPVRLVQMWVVPDEAALTPGYEQLEVGDLLASGDLVTVASGMARHRDASAIRINNRFAALHVARLAPGGSVLLPEAPYLHLFVARGSVGLEGAGSLAEGDAVRLTATGGQRVSAHEPAEVLVWEMHVALPER
jgi:redox-sensitive bicupin YhaK (pirin superfamily)